MWSGVGLGCVCVCVLGGVVCVCVRVCVVAVVGGVVVLISVSPQACAQKLFYVSTLTRHKRYTKDPT